MKATLCETCGATILRNGTFVDGKTKMGPWAIMCEGCHGVYGVGLGTGRGQKYQMPDGIKIEG